MSAARANDPTELSFADAMQELEAVLHRIEGEEIDIDQLGRELGRAAALLEVCRAKIRRAEVEVQQIVEKIEADEPVAAGVADDPEPKEAADWSRSEAAAAEAYEENVWEDHQRELREEDPGMDLETAREQGNLPGHEDDIPF